MLLHFGENSTVTFTEPRGTVPVDMGTGAALAALTYSTSGMAWRMLNNMSYSLIIDRMREDQGPTGLVYTDALAHRMLERGVQTQRTLTATVVR
jgi:hypothetical protein